MTRLYNSNINNMTLPALDDMKRKHENGGILKYQNPATTLDLPEGSEYGGELKPAVVKPKPYLGILNTYYPIISEYPFTGHSELDLYDSDGVFVNHISKYGDNYDYNLVTNNCSDATRRAVEKIFGEKINPYLFTTPGDVQDFVVEKTGQKPAKEGAGQTSLEFNIPFATAMDLKNQNLDFYIQDYLYKARKIKKQMKEKNPNWNSDSFDLSTSEVIQRYEDQKYKFQPFKNKKGGSIHIKKKNRGKFTDYCGGKVTEECIAKGKKSKDPKIRKRATFAANARKWKHENGGILKALDYAKYITKNRLLTN